MDRCAESTDEEIQEIPLVDADSSFLVRLDGWIFLRRVAIRMKRIRFKPTHADLLRRNDAAQWFYAAGANMDPPAELLNSIAPKRERAAPVQREAPVVSAVRALLARHPKVLWALRVNSGSASYEAKSGKWAPVKFHEWLRSPVKMRMPDFLGLLTDGRILALEAKRPDWSKPTDQREIEQEAFLECIRFQGGVAEFVRSVEEAQAAIEGGAWAK